MNTNDRPTPETDTELDEHGRYLHGEVLDGTRSEIMYVRAKFARRLERQRDALAEAWRKYLSAAQIIEQAAFGDNYTDAARARVRQQRAIGQARAAIRAAKEGS